MTSSRTAGVSRATVLSLVLVLVLAGLLVAVVAAASGNPASVPAANVVAAMPPADALDDRWGTYVSEREWGNPRESQGGSGWGMSILDATKQDYRFAEDGIAALSDDAGEFHVGWAFWDGTTPLVTERLFGLSNPQGAHGETIIDRRTFGANTTTHSYADFRLELPRPGLAIQAPGAVPNPPSTWDVRLESAKVDDGAMVMRAVP